MLPAHALDLGLSAAVQMALERNANVLSSRMARTADRFDLAVERQQFTPLFSVSGFTQRLRDEAGHLASAATSTQAGPSLRWGLPTGAQISYGWSLTRDGGMAWAPARGRVYTLTVTQPLLKGAGQRVAGAPLQQAQWRDEISRLRRDAAVSSVITDVVLSYRAYQRAIRAREIAEAGVARAAELLRVNQSLVDAGRLAFGELLQAQADQAAQRQALAQSELAQLAARLTLVGLLRLPVGDPLTPTEPLTVQVRTPPKSETAVLLALAYQPEYQQMLLGVQQAELQRDVARNARLPDVALTLTRGGAGSAGQLPVSSTAVGLQWSVPLNDLSLQRPQVQADSALAQTQLALRVAEEQIESAVQLALGQLAVLTQQMDLATTRLDLSRHKLALELEKLKAGRSSNFQVLAFQDDLRQAELSELDARVEYLNALNSLDRLLGTTMQTWKVSFDD